MTSCVARVARSSAWLTAAAALALGLAGQPALADTYVLDKQHTEVRFAWSHLGLSRQSGRFLDVDGTLELDPEQPEASRLDVKIRVASLSTGVKELDNGLRSREFFDTAQFPTATFRSTSVKHLGAKTAQVTGDLTLAGKTAPVTLDVTWNFIGEHPLSQINPVYTDMYYTGFSAHGELRRSDWGITRTIPYVSDEIQLTIEAELKRTAISSLVAPPAPPGSVEQAPLPPLVPPPAARAGAQ
jgi:polyisoprenoid-binding protein YceI